MKPASGGDLPVEACLPSLRSILAAGRPAILVAPPGAGKTTVVPPALLDEPWLAGRKLLLVVPRRVAARAAAARIAHLLDSAVGELAGYRVRMDSRISDRTRIEVVTAGVFVRIIAEDPELAGYGAVLFDEFHERSLDADTGLALMLDVRGALRPDIALAIMSATPDTQGLMRLLADAEIVESTGRSHRVEIRHEPPPDGTRPAEAMVRAIKAALNSSEGGILCFLPGVGEIRQVAERLEPELPEGVVLHQLHGGLDPGEQDRAIAPAPPGTRKIVLATAIAETSLTLEDVRTVIDSGLARQPRHEPGSGFTRLETVRASKASITQRAGRAGRTAPGVAIRLWHEGRNSALPDHAPPEIMQADLASLALELAAWGVSDPATLLWLDPPPSPAWREAVTSLGEIGAVDEAGAITPHGRLLTGFPLAPLLANMVVKAAAYAQQEQAARLALLVSERGLGGMEADLALRADRLTRDRSRRARNALSLAQGLARRAAGLRPALPNEVRPDRTKPLSAGALLSLAWPMRIARNIGTGPRGEALWRIAGGRQAFCEGDDPLAREDWIVAADIQGSAANARVMAGASLELDELERLHGHLIRPFQEVESGAGGARFKVRETLRLGSLIIRSHPLPAGAIAGLDTMMADWLAGQERLDPFLGDGARALRARLAFLHHHRPQEVPPMDDATLLATTRQWLLPFLAGCSGFSEVGDSKWRHALMAAAGVTGRSSGNAIANRVDQLAPSRLELPNGRKLPMRYEEKSAIISARAQEFFGLSVHPAVLDGEQPVLVELLSPAMRPIQLTRDLPGFWKGSWKEVRREMRSNYPRHDWPEDPAAAQPPLRAGRRR